jgi:hypothetical protein
VSEWRPLKYLNCDTQRKDRRRFFSEECLSACQGLEQQRAILDHDRVKQVHMREKRAVDPVKSVR